MSKFWGYPSVSNISVLPFYPWGYSIPDPSVPLGDLWDKNKTYAYGQQYKRIIKLPHIPTFQIITPKFVSVFSFSLCNIDGSPRYTIDPMWYPYMFQSLDLTDDTSLVYCKVQQKIWNGQYSLEGWPSTNMLDRTGIQEGWYFFKMVVAVEYPLGTIAKHYQYYSEPFYYAGTYYFSSITNDFTFQPQNHWELFFGNDETIFLPSNNAALAYPNAIYTSNYAIKYFDSFQFEAPMGYPTYELSEEGEDRASEFYTESNIYKKQLQCVITAPEYVCDILRMASVCDNIFLRNLHLNLADQIPDTAFIDIPIQKFDFEVEWLSQGNAAAITMTFEPDTLIRKVGYAATTVS